MGLVGLKYEFIWQTVSDKLGILLEFFESVPISALGEFKKSGQRIITWLITEPELNISKITVLKFIIPIHKVNTSKENKKRSQKNNQ